MSKNKYDLWLDWARELQFLAQSGLAYSKDKFDIERFNRIREISAEIVAHKTEIPIGIVKDLFCNEKGFQTPKIETRAAIFEKDKILLVKEDDGLWALPGGWVDEAQSVKANVEKEAFEEAGVKVKAERIIALHDRNKRNEGTFIHNICKVFVLCTYLSGEFKENIETTESGYFTLDNLPPLATTKTTKEQLKMCFRAKDNETQPVEFD